MIDPFAAPGLDAMMGGMGGGAMAGAGMGSTMGSNPEVEQIFQKLMQIAQQLQQQALARGAQLGPIDELAMREKAEKIARGENPVEPEEMQQADYHMEMSGMGDMAPSRVMEQQAQQQGGSGGPWSRIGSTFQGQDVPQEVARQSRWGALGDTANQIARGFGTGNLDQAISGFAGGFGENLERRLGAGLERSRQAELDAMNRQRFRREGEAADFSLARGRAEFKQKQKDRDSLSESMRAMAEEIEKVAGPDSPFTAKAKAMVKGGPDLADELEATYREVLGLTVEPGMETDAEIAKRKRIYEEDPQARFNRGISERNIAVQESYANRPRTEGGGLTMSSFLSNVRMEQGRILEEKILSEFPQAKWGMPVPPDVLDRLRVEAEEEARRLVQDRAGEVGGTSARTPSAASDEQILAKARAAMANKADIERIQEGILEAVGGDIERARRILQQLLGQ